MWATLRRLGILKEFIDWIRALYKDADIRLSINGYFSGKIPIRYGVRQGDPLSCPLFVAVIERLACLIMQDARIQGVEIDGQLIKITIFADNTTIILRNQAEADAVMKLLNTYGEASGLKTNLSKSFLLLMGGAQISIPGVRVISPEVYYVHLGIPVGEMITDHLKVF